MATLTVARTYPLAVPEVLERFRAPRSAPPRIQLVRPYRTMSRHYYSILASPPLGLAYLAGILETAGYPVDIIDGQGEGLDQWALSPCGRFRYQGLTAEQILDRIDASTRIVGVSLMFSQEWVRNRELIRRIRARFPDVVIVAGGEHVTALPEETLRQCPEIDYIVCGEGEVTMLALAHRIATGEDVEALPGTGYRRGDSIVLNGSSLRINDVDNLPRPAWHVCRVDGYFRMEWKLSDQADRTMPILGTRGCPYQCTFCSNPAMWTTRYKMRDPIAVVDEIEDLMLRYGVTSVDFFDLTAIVKKSWILDFCSELRRRRLKITWNLPTGTRSEALDNETLRAIYDAGCTFLSYAPESGSVRTLKKIKKQIKLENLMSSVRTAVAIGHHTRIFVIVGFPHETREDVLRSLWLVARAALDGVNDINVFIFTPYPGSELFQELREAGVIGPLDDAYFDGLFAQADMTVRRSFCRALSWYELSVYRVGGMVMFYALGYLVRPRRLVRLLGGLLRGDFVPQNVLERRIVDFVSVLRRGGAGPKRSPQH